MISANIERLTKEILELEEENEYLKLKISALEKQYDSLFEKYLSSKYEFGTRNISW